MFEGSGDTFSKRSLLMALDLIDASGHGLAEVATLRTARLLAVDDGVSVTLQRTERRFVGGSRYSA